MGDSNQLYDDAGNVYSRLLQLFYLFTELDHRLNNINNTKKSLNPSENEIAFRWSKLWMWNFKHRIGHCQLDSLKIIRKKLYKSIP